MNPTEIPFVTHTCNPQRGCWKCAAGCENCYAERMAMRLACMGNELYQKLVTDGWTGKVIWDQKECDAPRRRKKPSKIMVCSMSDIALASPDEIFALWKMMDFARQHHYAIFTKRPKMLAEKMAMRFDGTGLPNVTGVFSASTQADLDAGIEDFLAAPFARRVLSLEPLLGPIRLPDGIDGVIVGCETGPNRRPCKDGWINSITVQRLAIAKLSLADILCFVKQLEIDGKVCADPTRFPEWARVRGDMFPIPNPEA